ncbi:hypothetical protein SIAM614_08234 [Stappia aggregata IAM 12614]|uniref:Methyltransferase domain-containing protein n=1 Tax=Roseibium aggregatum (strain ATCC 25650 / DSM 13394 / JCM 20685 / NBRC 16684 / NCIMB 2208 / IAM 12614 / B1) TaxID=384765 RepID=A0P210_ROSAI|nr:hypothetical protein [Roseibium aggregatum]EAV40866.1 hypothetical protein SIAM614_08234 [Stappia aggregata IAM 12614] [Roseibium aggregatum IAM 12614]
MTDTGIGSLEESVLAYEVLKLSEIAERCGVPMSSAAVTDWFDAESHLRYRRPTTDERDKILLDVVGFLQDDSLKRSGAHRIDAWRKGWGEIHDRIAEASFDYDTLCPQYFKFDAFRFDGDYALRQDKLFEFALCHAVKTTLYANYIQDGDRIVDLGTGSAANVYLLLNMFKSSQVVGADWAEPSVEITNKISTYYDGRAMGARLDMLSLEGRESLGTLTDNVVLSVHSFEQLGTQWQGILKMLLEAKPKICIQIEPIYENYEDEPIFDALGRLYHNKRGYLRGYQTELMRLADANKVEILDQRRLTFGTMLHEPYGVLVWRPK